MIHPSSNVPSRRWMLLLRPGLPVVVLVVCCTLLWQRLATMQMSEIAAALGQVSLGQWALAALATWASFQAIGRYDAVWHHMMGTGVSGDRGRRAGIRAVAVAQLVGFGAITSSLVRWWCMPRLSLWQATQLSLAVTITFTLCWSAYALGAIWSLGITVGSLIATPIALIFLLFFGVFCLLAGRHVVPIRLRPANISVLFVLTGLDVLFAALALFILLPDGLSIMFSTLLAAYIIALGAGLLSNAPGGAGAFDLALLALLPVSEQESLVAAIIAFRLVYYVVPAALALAAIAHSGKVSHAPTNAPAAWGLARQSGSVSDVAGHGWFIQRLPLVVVSLGARIGLCTRPATIASFQKHALLRGRVPVLYNCDARTAFGARRLGWYVRRTAMEAIILPSEWSTTGHKRQTLRRKLRAAEKSGISVKPAEGNLPLEDMCRIAANWARSRGGEHGFSMGRYDPCYVSDQRIFLIKKHGYLTGFITFHGNSSAWSLDLIRHDDALPDGAIHAGLVAAIEQAKCLDVAQVSLAAVPDPRHTPSIWARQRAGLIQFKRSFAPIWVARYHAAPNRFAFWFSGAMIALAVHRPVSNLRWKAAAALHRTAHLLKPILFRIAVGRQT